MICFRCHYNFCWCCMGPRTTGHNTWYKLCPNLPFSLCVNLIVTFLFIILLPAVITVGPLLVICAYSCIVWPYEITRRCSLTCKILVWLIFLLILFPLAVALGMTAVVIADAFAIVPLYYYSISFFIRLSITGCRTKL